MNWKITGFVFLFLILPVFGWWWLDSSDYGEMIVFSKEKKPVEVVTVDELFGTETKSTDWVDGFWLGLLPPDDKISPKALLGAVPLSGVLLVIGGLSLFINYRKNKRNHS